MRISGLATGMDTEQIIKDMMKAERIPLDKITQKKQYLQWQLDDYRSINRKLWDSANNIADTVGRQGTFMKKSVSISNPDAVNIKGLGGSNEFSGTIEIGRLATQASLRSGELKKNLSPADVDKESLGLSADGKFTIQAPNGEETEISVTTADTIGSVLSKINKSNAGVTAFYDSFTGKIAMTAKDSGSGKTNGEIIIKDQIGDAAAQLKLTTAEHTAGVNAEFTFNGLTTERSSNTFTINGFEVNLKQVTTGPVTFSSAPDTDKIVETVVKFVDDYNKMIDELNAKIREPKYRSYQPLSDEQKKDMKEKEIELWEEKAKSGTLRNDPSISNLLTTLRQAVSEQVKLSDGTSISLKDIGIEQIKDFKENGKLQINEDKLREAITENPNRVAELFSKSSTETDKGGIAQQFKKAMDDTRKVLTEKAGTSGAVSDTFALGRTMKTINKQIERFEERLKMTEDRYWKQFTAMERAIQRANAQSASLMNAFGGA